jgi:NADH-quinone oxidoreductase subunit J
METFFFLIVAGICIISAVNVLIERHPIYSALSLIVTFLGLAGIYLQLQAEFIAVMQIVIYTGAIMVLFVFVIMLLKADAGEMRPTNLRFVKYLGIPLAVLLVAEIVFIILRTSSQPGTVIPPLSAAAGGNTESIGKVLYTQYALPFEVTSILLLAAILGVIVLAKKES